MDDTVPAFRSNDRPSGYHFGDITRGFVRWLGPSARFVRNKVDWLKFAKALVAAFAATGTLNYGTAILAFLGAVNDPDIVAKAPAILGVIVGIVEFIRRFRQGTPTNVVDVTPAPAPTPVTPVEPTNGPQDSSTDEHNVFGV